MRNSRHFCYSPNSFVLQEPHTIRVASKDVDLPNLGPLLSKDLEDSEVVSQEDN